MLDDLAELKAQLAAVTAERDRLAFGPPLEAAIEAIGVRLAFRASVKALFLRQGKMELIDGEVLSNGLSVADAVRAWAATDEGKAFIRGPADAAPAGRGAPSAKRRSEMRAAEKGAFIREHGLEAFEKLPR